MVKPRLKDGNWLCVMRVGKQDHYLDYNGAMWMWSGSGWKLTGKRLYTLEEIKQLCEEDNRLIKA